MTLRASSGSELQTFYEVILCQSNYWHACRYCVKEYLLVQERRSSYCRIAVANLDKMVSMIPENITRSDNDLWILGYTEKKKRAKMALWESNFENRLSFGGGEPLFFFIIMFRKMKALPVKREQFSKTSRFSVKKGCKWFSFWKKRAGIAPQESCYGSPGEPFHLIKKGWKWCWLGNPRGGGGSPYTRYTRVCHFGRVSLRQIYLTSK